MNAVNGANDSGAQFAPPSVEYEMPHPSLKCQSFHMPSITRPVGSMPSDSSFAANWSSVTCTGDETEVAAPASDVATSTQATAATSRPILFM